MGEHANDPHLSFSDKNFTRIYQPNVLFSVNKRTTVLHNLKEIKWEVRAGYLGPTLR